MTQHLRKLLTAAWKRRELLLICTDLVWVVGVFVALYYLRFHIGFLALRSVAVSPVGVYLRGGCLLAVLWIFILHYGGGYRHGLLGIEAPVVKMQRLISSGVIALGLLMAISFMYREFLLSRQVYFMAIPVSCIPMLLCRFVFYRFDRLLARKGITTQRIVLFGSDEQSEAFAKRVEELRGTAFIVGTMEGHTSSCSIENTQTDCLAAQKDGALTDSIRGLLSKTQFDMLIFSAEGWRRMRTPEMLPKLIEITNFCEARGIGIFACSPDTDMAISAGDVGAFAGIVMFQLRDASLHPLYAFIKRAMDIAVSLVVLIVGLPFWLLLAILLKTSSKGPVIFSQVRAGLHGRPFRMYKFRSMVVDAEERLSELLDLETLASPVFKLENDPRVTAFGRFLRRLSLDEVPQFINVLKGEMSLVGPRPEELGMVSRYNALQRRRLKGKPGITGLQQVSNRGGADLAQRVRYDLLYLKNQSLLMDLYVIVRTIGVVLRGSGITH